MNKLLSVLLAIIVITGLVSCNNSSDIKYIDEKNEKVEVINLSDEEHRKINIFFSNFSEAYFTSYDVIIIS